MPYSIPSVYARAALCQSTGFWRSLVLGPYKDCKDCVKHMAQWMMFPVSYTPCKFSALSVMAWPPYRVFIVKLVRFYLRNWDI